MVQIIILNHIIFEDKLVHDVARGVVDCVDILVLKGA